MPAHAPIPDDLRSAISTDLAAGVGRNATARRHGVSTGLVSKVARSVGQTFPNAPTRATECARIDAALARIEREKQLIQEQTLALAHRRLRRARRLEKRINDINRFHLPLTI